MRETSEDDLWVAVREGDEAARDEIVRRYQDLLQRAAMTLVRGLPSHVAAEDLVSYGALGLLKAVDRYGALEDDDPRRGPGRFRKYAMILIYSRILDELRALDWAPKAFRRKVKDVDRAREELRRPDGSDPTVEEVAEHLGWDEEQVRVVDLSVRQFSMISLDEEPVGTSMSVREVPAEEMGTASSAALSQVQEHVVDWLWSLPVEHRLIMARCYFEEKTLGSIAAEMGIPLGQVMSIHSQLVVDLRERVISAMGLRSA